MKYNFTANSAAKLSQIISENIPGLSSPALKTLLAGGEIRLNGAKQKQDCPVSKGDTISVFVPQKYLSHAPVNIVYSDENIVVADKPPFMDVENNLAGLIKKDFPSSRPMHRLDRNTAGLVVFALNDQTYKQLYAAFKQRLVEKYYYALVQGDFKKEGRFTAYLKKDAEKGYALISDVPAQGYQKIITEFWLEGGCNTNAAGSAKSSIQKDRDYFRGYSLVKIKLITGRTHQIRAHLAHMGYPVIGDNKYIRDESGGSGIFKHQQLLAYQIVFNGLVPPLSYLNGREFRTGQKLEAI